MRVTNGRAASCGATPANTRPGPLGVPFDDSRWAPHVSSTYRGIGRGHLPSITVFTYCCDLQAEVSGNVRCRPPLSSWIG